MQSDATATPERRTSPWLLAAVFFVVYLLTLQRQLFNDGIFFEVKLQLGGTELIYNHILFLPVVSLLRHAISLVVPITPELAMKLVAAFAGACGVALTHMVARRVVRAQHRTGEHQARTAAILTGILMGYWFHSTATEVHSVHAACSLLLLLGLVRVLLATDNERVGLGTWLLIASGACLSPASHVSGVCVALPVAYVWLTARAPGARLGLTIAMVTGAAVFGAAYLTLMSYLPSFEGYTDAHTGKFAVLWENPEYLPRLFRACAAESMLYSTPGSTFVPAGLYLLFRSAPRLAWLCLCWLAAWPLIAWPVGDWGLGQYYTPIFPVQALLAVVVMRHATTSLSRAIVTATVGAIPVVAFVYSREFAHKLGPMVGLAPMDVPEIGGLSVLALCAVAAFFCLDRARNTTPEPRRLRILLIATFVISGPHIVNVSFQDPKRDRIVEVIAELKKVETPDGRKPLLIFLAPNTNIHHHWENYYPRLWGEDGLHVPEHEAFNPTKLGYLFDPDDAPKVLARMQKILHEAFDSKRPVFLEGSVQAALVSAKNNPQLQQFFADIVGRADLKPTGVKDLQRIVPR